MDKSVQREASSDDSAGRSRRDPDESAPRAVESGHIAGRLRRDLGALESYAALLGILIGAGIFTVTSDAGALTGPSVILGYVVLFPVILATSVPYSAFLSTPLGQEPGGEYTHISQTLAKTSGGRRLAEDHLLHRRRGFSGEFAGRLFDCGLRRSARPGVEPIVACPHEPALLLPGSLNR